jgi:hypothetical protein
MRGSDTVCGALFSDVDLEKRVRPDHSLRMTRRSAESTISPNSVGLPASVTDASAPPGDAV